jgi:hypothetical protein
MPTPSPDWLRAPRPGSGLSPMGFTSPLLYDPITSQKMSLTYEIFLVILLCGLASLQVRYDTERGTFLSRHLQVAIHLSWMHHRDPEEEDPHAAHHRRRRRRKRLLMIFTQSLKLIKKTISDVPLYAMAFAFGSMGTCQMATLQAPARRGLNLVWNNLCTASCQTTVMEGFLALPRAVVTADWFEHIEKVWMHRGMPCRVVVSMLSISKGYGWHRGFSISC